MPSLANLRSHKNKAVNFTPSKAYWIVGHGGEPNDGSTFTVPPGCIIVVKVSPGQLSYVHQKIFVTLDKEKLKDPIKNSNYLVKKFGSVAIFKPGDQCPIFYYELLACFPSDPLPGEESYKRCNTLSSGVLDIDNVYNTQTELLPVPEGDILEYIANLYKDSVYPTKQQVKDRIANFTTNESLTSVQKLNLIWNTLLSDICRINQENLCKKLGRGVYYNFVCRYRGKETDNVYGSLIENSLSYHSSARGVEELQSNNFALLRNKIGEAETKRKGLLRNYYVSPEYNPPEYNPPEKSKPINLDENNIFKSPDVLANYINFRKPLSKIIHFLENIEYYRGHFTVDEIINYKYRLSEDTPLSLAIMLNMPELFALLIFLGAKTDITTRYRGSAGLDLSPSAPRRTLMDIALGTNEPRVVNMLEFVMNKTPSELLKIHKDSKKFGISKEFSKEKGFSKEIENYYKQEKGKTARNFKQPTNWLKQNKSSLYEETKPADLFWQITHSDFPNENIIETINLIMSTNFSSSLLHPSKFIYLKSTDDLINYVDNGKWGKPGQTPLWLAVEMDRIPLIKPLLKAGANDSIKVDGKTLAEIASPAAMAELGITGPVLGGKRNKNKKRQTRRYRTRRTMTRKN